MKGWMREHKIRTYFLIGIIIAVLFLVVELGFGFHVGKIPMGGGGEVNVYMTLGGNAIEKYYPMTCDEQPVKHYPDQVVVFSPPFFLLMFALRFIVIVPVTNLYLKER